MDQANAKKNLIQRNQPESASTYNRLRTLALSAVYNIGLQIALRLVTFVSNAFILRYISKDILGLINVRLLLLYTTIQFISREAFRRTCAPPTSESSTESDKRRSNVEWSEIVNVTSLTVPIACVAGLFFSVLWYTCMELPEEKLVSHYWYGISSIYLSVIIELLAESLYIYGQRNQYIRVKVIIEGIFQIIRCLLIASVVFISPQNAIIGFALAQLIASTVYSLCYLYYFLYVRHLPLKNFLPSFGKRPFLNPTLWKISTSFFVNTVLKQFLTEGERYVMTVFAVIGLAEQGVYDAINNLGSLPARLIFQAIEESSYQLFSSTIKRELPPERQQKQIIESLDICANLVRLMLLLGLTLFIYGHNCAQLALFLYGGHSLISGQYGTLAVRLLQWHCFYILFIALNGILESYSFAAMSAKKLNQFNAKMLVISGCFLLVSLLATSWLGSEGFIIANCFNMFLRILISLHLIGQVNTQSSLLSFILKCSPGLMTISSFAVTFWTVSILRQTFLQGHLSIESKSVWKFIASTGAILLVHMGLLIYYLQADLVTFVRARLFSSKAQSKAKTS